MGWTPCEQALSTHASLPLTMALMPTRQLGKQRSEIRPLACGHTANKWPAQHCNPVPQAWVDVKCGEGWPGPAGSSSLQYGD